VNGGYQLNRRDFSVLMSALLAAPALSTVAGAESAEPQSPSAPTKLAELASGVYTPSPPTGNAAHITRHFMAGLLPDNIRIEAHMSTLGPGAPHEAIGHHKHSEIWFMREGTATLMTNGVERTLTAGDLGICVAGNEHYIGNASNTETVSYYVISVGPPE
jgi:mannose-6-phosphate isomerase-like protein (cupin superfamily)